MPKVKTSFSIVASSARGLSACDSSAEVEMRRAEGEDQGLIKGPDRFDGNEPLVHTVLVTAECVTTNHCSEPRAVPHLEGDPV